MSNIDSYFYCSSLRGKGYMLSKVVDGEFMSAERYPSRLVGQYMTLNGADILLLNDNGLTCFIVKNVSSTDNAVRDRRGANIYINAVFCSEDSLMIRRLFCDAMADYPRFAKAIYTVYNSDAPDNALGYEINGNKLKHLITVNSSDTSDMRFNDLVNLPSMKHVSLLNCLSYVMYYDIVINNIFAAVLSVPQSKYEEQFAKQPCFIVRFDYETVMDLSAVKPKGFIAAKNSTVISGNKKKHDFNLKLFLCVVLACFVLLILLIFCTDILLQASGI